MQLPHILYWLLAQLAGPCQVTQRSYDLKLDPNPLSDLQSSHSMLKSTHWLICSQCRDAINGTVKCSYFCTSIVFVKTASLLIRLRPFFVSKASERAPLHLLYHAQWSSGERYQPSQSRHDKQHKWSPMNRPRVVWYFCDTVSHPLSPSAGCSWVPHGEDDHPADHFSGWCGEYWPCGGKQAEGHLPGELQGLSSRERYRSDNFL